jgi:tetratricopeptide (TPR) repeat protein
MNADADEIEQVDRDLTEVAAQLDAGELDAVTAERLRTAYERERAAIVAATSGPRLVEGRSPRRMLMGASILIVGIVAVAASGVISAQSDTPEQAATAGVAADAEEGGVVDLSSVTNEEMEAVIAANPSVVGMRLALAERYVEAGDHSKALDHYLAVLDQSPEQPEALAMVGWLTFLAGEPELAEPFVAKSLEIEPEYPLALWFLGNILLANGDHDGATLAIEQLLGYELSPEVRSEADALLADAKLAGIER